MSTKFAQFVDNRKPINTVISRPTDRALSWYTDPIQDPNNPGKWLLRCANTPEPKSLAPNDSKDIDRTLRNEFIFSSDGKVPHQFSSQAAAQRINLGGQLVVPETGDLIEWPGIFNLLNNSNQVTGDLLETCQSLAFYTDGVNPANWIQYGRPRQHRNARPRVDVTAAMSLDDL